MGKPVHSYKWPGGWGRGAPPAGDVCVFLTWQEQSAGLKSLLRRPSQSIGPSAWTLRLFGGSPLLFHPLSLQVRVSECRRQWSHEWEGQQWKFGGKHRAWVERKHTWNILRGNLTGKGLRGCCHLRGLVRETWRLCALFNIKKIYLTNKGRVWNTGRVPPTMRNNYYPLNRTNVPGIQSHLISREDSGSVLGTGEFPHLVPLMEMSTQSPLFSWHI